MQRVSGARDFARSGDLDGGCESRLPQTPVQFVKWHTLHFAPPVFMLNISVRLGTFAKEATVRRNFIILLSFLLLATSVSTAQTSGREAKYVRLGISRFEKQDFDGAIAFFNEAIRTNPKLASAYVNRGKARRAKGDLEGAISDYEEAIEIDPRVAENNRDIAEAYSNRGYVKSRSLDLDGAVDDFNKAIKFYRNDADMYLKRGCALLIGGSVQEAISDFDAAIKLDDDNPLAYADRGIARMQVGDAKGARADFDKSLQLNRGPKVLLQMHVLEIKHLIEEVRQRRAKYMEKVA